MKKWLKGAAANAGLVGQFFVLLWKQKLWWLIPLVVILILFGLFLVFTSVSGVAPFIYTLI
ncbi:MAG: DUF5989 family protein [Candidatus Aminicenantes bacterium]|jgi:hypothetical protein|nr:DUF5989 family protein [Candidatus Aminicenantes bacterium]